MSRRYDCPTFAGDAFHGMARSLSLATERVCFEHGVPATREDQGPLVGKGI